MLTDLTGQYYTLVLEGTFKDLADYEKFLRREMAGAGDVYPPEVRAPGRFGAARDLHGRGIEEVARSPSSGGHPARCPPEEAENVTDHDVVVVGAGQAGLGVSYFLQRDGREHVVLERGRIGETWLSQRWDSFTLNTPDFMNVLPGLPYDGQGRDTFSRGEALVRHFQRYVREFTCR